MDKKPRSTSGTSLPPSSLPWCKPSTRQASNTRWSRTAASIIFAVAVYMLFRTAGSWIKLIW